MANIYDVICVVHDDLGRRTEQLVIVAGFLLRVIFSVS